MTSLPMKGRNTLLGLALLAALASPSATAEDEAVQTRARAFRERNFAGASSRESGSRARATS